MSANAFNRKRTCAGFVVPLTSLVLAGCVGTRVEPAELGPPSWTPTSPAPSVVPLPNFASVGGELPARKVLLRPSAVQCVAR